MAINMSTSVAGLSFIVRVDDTGHFTASFEDEDYRSDTLSGLRGHLAKAIESDRRKNPIAFIDAETGRAGMMRGMHATRRVVLVTWDDGTKDDISTYRRVWRMQDVDPVDVAEIKLLEEEIQQRRTRLSDLRRSAVQATELL